MNGINNVKILSNKPPGQTYSETNGHGGTSIHHAYSFIDGVLSFSFHLVFFGFSKKKTYFAYTKRSDVIWLSGKCASFIIFG